MKTLPTMLLAAFFGSLFCIVPIFGQQNNASGEKQITIVKHSTDADGNTATETIIKKGKAAENFDVDNYMQENRSDKVHIEIRIDDGEDLGEIHVKHNYNFNKNHGGKGMLWASCNNDGPFLGVDQDSDEDATQPGITVQVVKGSAAAKAGLKTNDIILKLNDTPVNEWQELSAFINQSKPGDVVKVQYLRNGKEASTQATLTKQSDVKQDCSAKHGFLGISPQEASAEDDKEGVAIRVIDNAAAESAGLQDGDVILKLNDTKISDWEDISDVMEDTQAGDKLRVVYERKGEQKTMEINAGEQKTWGMESGEDINLSPGKVMDINVREKEACLGVYTGAYTINNQEGTRINDFTEESAARDVQMVKGDLITAVNGTPVKGHDDLWNEIAKYKPGEQINLEYLHDNKPLTVTATLKACKDNASQVVVTDTDNAGDAQTRQFYTWNWGNAEEKNMRLHRVITIHRGEGDASKVNESPNPPTTDRSLKLQSFRAFPNPTQGQVTVSFQGEPVATIVSLFDLSGRQLFREELNAFGGDYNQQFDLSEYAKGTILIQVVQGDKVYTEQIIVQE